MISFPKWYSQKGFTIVEVVLVVLIFGILATVVLAGAPSYLSRRRDSQRKADLHTLKVVLEDYNGDESCYPPVNVMQSCGSTGLSPYLRQVPCDPETNQPYRYVLSGDCQGYQIYTVLENTSDPDIESLGCESGCGPANGYNYGVVGGTSLLDR